MITVTVDGTPRTFTDPTSTDWVEEWSAGAVDIWIAKRLVSGVVQVEYELSVRAIVAVGTVTISVPGAALKTITVGMNWPAGRGLSGRIGPEMDVWERWGTVYRSHHGPCEMPLPDITDDTAQETWAADRLSALRTALTNQTTVDIDDSEDGLSTWIGPFPMWEREDPGPGAPGGTGIYHTTGWQDCLSYARLACEVEAVYMSRMWCFYNSDGTVFSVDAFTAPNAPYCNSEAGTKPAPFNVGADTLWRPISLSHYCRVIRYVGAAYEMTGSRLALRHMISLAECARLQWSDRSLADYAPGSHCNFNLTTYEKLIDDEGFDNASGFNYSPLGSSVAQWDRNHGWTLWVAAYAKYLGMTWSLGWQNWAERFIAAMVSTQMTNGLFSRNTTAVSAVHDISAPMHEGMIGLGLRALSKQTGIAVDLTSHATALYRTLPEQYYNGQYGPWHHLHCGPFDNGGPAYAVVPSGQAELTDPLNPGDPLPVEVYLAAMYGMTLDASWLTTSLEYGFQAATIPLKLADLTNSLGTTSSDIMDRSWQAHLYAYLQGYSVTSGLSRTFVVRQSQAAPIRRVAVTRKIT